MAHLQSRYHNNTKNTYHLSSFWILLQLSPQLLNFGHRYGRQQHSLLLSFECIPHSTQWSWLDALWEFLSRWPVVSTQTPLLFCDSIFHVVTLKHPCLSDWSFEIIPISTKPFGHRKNHSASNADLTHWWVLLLHLVPSAPCRHPVSAKGTVTKLALWWHLNINAKFGRNLWMPCGIPVIYCDLSSTTRRFRRIWYSIPPSF